MTNIEVILKYLETAESIGTEEVILKGFDVRVLNDYIKTQTEKIRKLNNLINYLDKEIENITAELDTIVL